MVFHAVVAFVAAVSFLVQTEVGYGRISCYSLGSGFGRCSISYDLRAYPVEGVLHGVKYVSTTSCPTGNSIQFQSGRASYGRTNWRTGEGSLCVPRVGEIDRVMGGIEWSSSDNQTYDTTIRASPTAVTSGSYIASSKVELARL